jgi:hypothetical protein
MNRRRRALDELGGRLWNASSEVADQLGGRARKLSTAASDRLPDAYRWTRSAARDASDGARDLAEDGYRVAGRHFGAANKITSDGLSGNVLPALLLAGAVGYIVSYVVHRRKGLSRKVRNLSTKTTVDGKVGADIPVQASHDAGEQTT